MKNHFFRKENRAIALVTVLLIIAMMAILVMTFFSTMTIEHRSAVSFADTQRAKMVSQGAVAHAIELLRTNIPDPAPIDRSAANAEAKAWVINPGLLTVQTDNSGPVEINLHSGAADQAPDTTGDPDVFSVDLNEPVPGKLVPAICYVQDENGIVDTQSDPPVMRVKWVNILQDPSKEASVDNPVIARHAFWIDDESGKINFNTAMGKPDPGEDRNYDKQRAAGMMPSGFVGGSTDMRQNDDAKWQFRFGLGRPTSVNLDVLFENKDDLDIDSLSTHGFLRGFSRYPEAILSFVNMSEDKRREWFHQNQYDLTFYSRSPEFNIFGRPRFMTTHIPLSLEGGPYYQLPFVYDDGSLGSTQDISGILHLSSLMGTLGFTHTVDRGTDEQTLAANVVNRAQAEMMMRYFDRKFPGYSGSFVDKYGKSECAQIALNILNMARFATTGMNNRVDLFSRDQALRTTSVLYAPNKTERRPKRRNHNGHIWETPERHYWLYDPDAEVGKGFLSREQRKQQEDEGWATTSDNAIRMIASTPGPHVTEVRLVFRTEIPNQNNDLFPDWVFKRPLNNPDNAATIKQPLVNLTRYLKVRLEVEYYMHEAGPEADLHYFPILTDYISFDISGDMNLNRWFRLDGSPTNRGAFTFQNELGPPTPNEDDLYAMNTDGSSRHTNWGWWDRNWRWNANRVKRDDAGAPILNDNGKNTHEVNQRSVGSMAIYPGHQRLSPIKSKNRKTITGGWRYIGRFVDRNFQTGRYLGNFPPNRPHVNQLPRLFHSMDTLEVKVNYRGGMSCRSDTNRARQMWPLGEGLGDAMENVLEGTVTIPMIAPGSEHSISWQISDPRLSGHKNQWLVETATGARAGTYNQQNSNEPDEDSDEKSKFRYLQRTPVRDKDGNILRLYGLRTSRGTEYSTNSVVSSKGFWTMIPTGIQGKDGGDPVPWRTFSLSPGDTSPPDHLFMDLMGSTYPMQREQWRINSVLPDEFSTLSFMHSTAGTINLNTKPFPDNEYFNAPQRTRPLEAVFTGIRSDSDVRSLVSAINQYQADKRFMYTGELAEVPGYEVGETQFDKEDLLRNMIGCLTTQSNTFGVWGVGQVVKKVRQNEKYGEFEDGDVVRGEKRFYALIERYIWPGIDGVPGNAHVDSQGKWDRNAKQTQDIQALATSEELGEETNTLFQLPGSPPTKRHFNNNTGKYNHGVNLDASGTYPEYDGPQKVEMNKYAQAVFGKVAHKNSKLEDAYNPPQPVIKYKVVYFKYLDE